MPGELVGESEEHRSSVLLVAEPVQFFGLSNQRQAAAVGIGNPFGCAKEVQRLAAPAIFEVLPSSVDQGGRGLGIVGPGGGPPLVLTGCRPSNVAAQEGLEGLRGAAKPLGQEAEAWTPCRESRAQALSY